MHTDLSSYKIIAKKKLNKNLLIRVMMQTKLPRHNKFTTL